MTGRYRDSFGDPAYLDGALGRLETGQPLRAVDLQELSYAIGREAALKLARTVEEERAKAARAPRRPSGLWGRFFGGPIHTGPELPAPVLRLIAGVRFGHRLAQLDADAAARAAGRRCRRSYGGPGCHSCGHPAPAARDPDRCPCPVPRAGPQRHPPSTPSREGIEVRARRYRAATRAGDAPVVYVDRGLVVRERIFVPLWVTMLEGFLGWCWRVLVRAVRLMVRYPIVTAVAVAETAAYHWRGWAAVTVLTATVALALTVWAWAWPGSFDRRVTVPLRSWWRFQRVYSRRWRDLMAGCGLLEVHDHLETMPQIARLRAHRRHDELLVALAPGQIPTDVTASGEALAHGLGAWRVTTRPAGPGAIWVLVLWADPLAGTVHPTDNTSNGGGGSGWAGVDLTGRDVLDRLAAVRVGVTETGRAWLLTLLPGRHLLASGTTGSGKSGLIWAILWALRDLIGAGWVTVTALDPKYVELRAVATSGLGTVVTDVPSMPAALEALVTELNERCEAMTGRSHLPSLASPVRIVIVDELATLTALADNKTKARVEQALGHLLSRGRAAGYLVILTSVEATKDVVRWRGLCATRVCYRTDDDQADLVLGDGAHDAGALTEQIPEDTPGVAYTRVEGRAGIERVRTVHLTDDHLAALHPAQPLEAGQGLAPDTAEIPVLNVIDLTHRAAAPHSDNHWSAS